MTHLGYFIERMIELNYFDNPYYQWKTVEFFSFLNINAKHVWNLRIPDSLSFPFFWDKTS